MPPIALAAVARAVRAGCDTMQKIRKRTRNHYNNHEIRQARPANPALARHPSKQPPTGINPALARHPSKQPPTGIHHS